MLSARLKVDEEALADLTSFVDFSADADDEPPLDHYAQDHPLPGGVADESNNDKFNEAPSRHRRSNRTNKAANTNNGPAKPGNKPFSNTQQTQASKGNQYLALPDDNLPDDYEELFNDPSTVAIAEGNNSRKPDAGDFDTSKDAKITHYFQTNLLGSKPEEQIKAIIKPVVTIWAREFPNYHRNQLGNNFNGKKKLGGLLSALGKSGFTLKPAMQMLNHNVRQAGAETLAALCEKLEDYLDKQTEKARLTNNTVTSVQQQKQSSQKPTNPAKSSATTPAGKQSANKSNKDKPGTLADYFNPMNSLHVTDLTVSQGDKDDAIIMDHPTEADEENKHGDTADPVSDDDDILDEEMTGGEFADQVEPTASSGSDPPRSPSKTPPTLPMLGGMPPIQISSPISAVPISGTNN